MRKITNSDFLQSITTTREYLLQEIENLDDTLELSAVKKIVLNTSIVDLDLSVRTLNALGGYDIRKVSDLIQFSEKDLFKIRNFGNRSLVEVKAVLVNLNLSLRHD
jgi:DNA-directed RNA polymerase subunit alpha